jgi:DNA-binding response OmpR family regulator
VTVVLIVEDSEPLGRLLETVLTRAGHQAVWAHTGAGALQEATTLAPGVVLIDLHLDDMEGCDLAEVLRRDLVGARLIAVSGEAPAQEVRQLFDAFLLKPVALDTLLGVISG